MIRPLAVLVLAGLAWTSEVTPPPRSHEVRVEGFRILAQTPEAETAELARELARVRGALAAWIGRNVRPLPGRLPPLPVLLFADRGEFTAYARGHARNVATAHAEGFYSGDGTPGGGSLCLFRDGGRELSTARHELVHYLLDMVLPAKAGQPVWFNEGLAVVAEDAWIDPGSVRPSAVPLQRMKTLRALAAEGGSPLSEVTALGADGWLEAAGADRTAAERQYAASYGAVLYLLTVHPERYWGFLRQLADGAEHGRAFAEAFTGIPGGLDAAWRAWADRGAWTAARAADPQESAAAAYEHGLAWLPENGQPGDPARAARWLAAAGRGFAQAEGYGLDAAAAWLAAGRALDGLDPVRSGEAAQTAAGLYAVRGHTAGQADAMIQATRGFGDDGPGGDWGRAAEAGRLAVQAAEAAGPDAIRASAYAAYGACFVPGRVAGRRAEGEAALLRARALHHAANETAAEASVVLLLAQVLAPDDGAAGDWDRCSQLAAEAEALWRSAKPSEVRPEDLARAVNARAGFHRPDRNPAGDWAVALALYESELPLLAGADDKRRLRNVLDRAACRLGLHDAGASALFREAEAIAAATGDTALAAFAAYQAGWSVQEGDPLAAAAAFRRAMPRYRSAGKPAEEAMAAGQAAQSLQRAKAPSAEIAEAYAAAAALEQARGDASRVGYCLYQQAWFSEPARSPGTDRAVAARLYRAASDAWRAAEPARAAQALSQRSRLLNPAKGERDGWDAAAQAWADTAAALAALPDAAKHQAERGSALHQQAWCLIRGDGARMTAEARRLFSEAVRLQRAGGDEAGARTSSSWIRD